MSANIMIRLLAGGFWLLFSVNPVFALTSHEYASMGKASWSAFECAVLAEKSNKTKEQERLFRYGYKQGKLFLDAIRLKKIKPDDISKDVPVYFPMLLSGPSIDFMLGRVYEFIVGLVYKQLPSTKETASVAEGLFWEKNCQLIGK